MSIPVAFSLLHISKFKSNDHTSLYRTIWPSGVAPMPVATTNASRSCEMGWSMPQTAAYRAGGCGSVDDAAPKGRLHLLLYTSSTQVSCKILPSDALYTRVTSEFFCGADVCISANWVYMTLTSRRRCRPAFFASRTSWQSRILEWGRCRWG